MFNTQSPLILASGSPRRKAYLQDLGLKFTVIVADIDEHPFKREDYRKFVRRMALEKAESVSRIFPDKWIVSADTIVVMDGEILGKPTDKKDALQMLTRLSGQIHQVCTGFVLMQKQKKILISQLVTTRVEFADYPLNILQAYVDTGEPLDKAGGYGIQGLGGFLVRKITGSYSNVVGLPLVELLDCLGKYGVIAPGLRESDLADLNSR